MIERVRTWRVRNELPEVEWSGGDSLYLQVENVPDRNASEVRPTGVTARVILRVRTWPRG